MTKPFARTVRAYGVSNGIVGKLPYGHPFKCKNYVPLYTRRQLGKTAERSSDGRNSIPAGKRKGNTVRVKVGFKAGNRVSYKACGESISAVIVTVHNESSVPGGFEYEIRITGRSRTYSKGAQFRTTGNYLSLRTVSKGNPKKAQERQAMATLKEMQDKLRGER